MKKIYIWSILTLIIATFLPGGLLAQEQTSANSTSAVAQRETGTHVTADEARAVGLRFLNANTSRTRGAGDLQMATAYRTAQGDTAFYVFNAANGFVMVAADRCATPILGYSDEGPFNTNNVPVQMQGYLQGFVEQIAYGIGHPTAADATKAQQWEQVRSTGHLTNSRANMAMGNNPANAIMANNRMTKSVMMARDSSGKMVRKDVSLNDLMNSNAKDNHIVMPTLPQSNRESRSGGNGVAPLITAMWDQDCYYNAACPVDTDGICGHVPTGCVATAMGMIMHYWGYPAQGTGAHSYTPDGYPTQTVNFGTTTYDWTNMPDQITATSSQTEIDAVSTLLWHCGVAADMLYGATSSSALDGSIPQAFSSYFGYCNGAYFLSKGDDAEWLAQVKASLDRNRPLLYFGTDVTGLGGHAFVCDGYDASDNLHFNWGWGGNGNGYFAVDAMNVNEFQFNNDIHALFGIVPQSEFQLHYNIIEGGVEVTYEQPVVGTPAYSNYPDTIVIPSQVTIDGTTYPVLAIGDKALQCCISLRKVFIPNSVKSIGEFAFYSSGQSPDITFVMSDSITYIGECAFLGTGIHSIDLPNSLKYIGEQAFSFCDQLTSITIPRSVTSAGHGLCLACSLLDTVNWYADSCELYFDPNYGIWESWDEATQLNIGEYVKYIPRNMFMYGNWKSVTIPESVISIGLHAFLDCHELTTINFNATNCQEASIQESSITTIIFGNEVTNIPDHCFYGSSVSSLDIPASVENIGWYAFGGCAYLDTVYLHSENPPSVACSFEYAKVFVIPCEFYNSYYNGNGWDWSCYETTGIYRYSLETVPKTEIQLTVLSNDTVMGAAEIYRNASLCDSTTVYFANAHFGYRFDHWSNGSTNNPDSLLLTGDSTVTAYFSKDQFNVTGQAGSHIFHSDFNNQQEDSFWVLKNENFVNRWYIDSLDGNRALYISNNGGLSNTYDNISSAVLAYKTLNLDSGNYLFSFDWRSMGNVSGVYSLDFGGGDRLVMGIYQGDAGNIPFSNEWGYYYDDVLYYDNR
ncbi:MAG: C10 family peptidase, partial [Bacteroidales bacterium]|nr:C10 family peptidase [Bacteroidales bacterium]